MKLTQTDEEALIRKTARRIAREEFEEKAFEWEGEFPWEHLELLGDHGLVGIHLAEKYGGGGGRVLEQIIAIEEVGRVCVDTGFALFEASLGPSHVIAAYGDKDQKNRYLPPILAGKDVMAIAISEPEAGTEATALQTRAETDGDTVTLNGQKTYVSNAGAAGGFLVYVKFKDGYIGTVIVDREDVTSINLQENMMGHHQGDLYFDNAEIPVENILLRGEDAFKKQFSAFNTERLGNATMSLSIAENAIDHAIAYAEEREQFGGPLTDQQVIREKIANMALETESARWLIYRGADHADPTAPDRILSSLAKTKANEMVTEVVDEALQIYGGAGYLKDNPIEYLYRAARGWKIAGGTVEIQREMIASDLIDRGDFNIPGL